MINDLEIFHEKYEVAWDLITKRYNTRVIAQSLPGSWDGLLIYWITNKLDRNSYTEWKKSITGFEMPQMTDFMSFIEQRR